MITLIVSFILFLFTVFALVRIPKPHGDLDRVPGPKKLPLIGHLHLLMSKTPAHRIFAELAAKHGPLMRLQLGEVPYLIVSSVEVASQVMKTNDVVFANRAPIMAAMVLAYNSTDIGLAPYGEYWRQLRKICTLELLSAKRVRYFRPIREEESSNMAAAIASSEGSPANLSEKIYQNSFDITSRASIGKEADDKMTVTAAVKKIMKLVSGLTIAELYPSNKLLPYITGLYFKIGRIFRLTDRILEGIIDRHIEPNAGGRPEDLTDVLLKYQREAADTQFRLTTDNIKAVILDMFLAGGETSATVVDWALSEMIRNPRTMKKAQDEVRRVFDDKGHVDEEKYNELKYLKLVIKETLRMHPPLPLLVPRESSERCEIDGYEIPAKTRLIVNAFALGRDPKYWNDADKFMPERFEDSSVDFKGNNLEYIPFGAGRRICPGMAFGLANVESSLVMLLYHFDWEMPNGMKGEELDMREELGSSTRRKLDLVLIPTLKRPLQMLK